jgi:hypothetical protein
MTYPSDPNEMSLTAGSIYSDSLASEWNPKVEKHIFLSEKAAWVMLPEDGSERWGTSEFAHLVQK